MAVKRRGSGEDSLYIDQANGYWVGSVSLGFTPDGKRRRRTVDALPPGVRSWWPGASRFAVGLESASWVAEGRVVSVTLIAVMVVTARGRPSSRAR